MTEFEKALFWLSGIGGGISVSRTEVIAHAGAHEARVFAGDMSVITLEDMQRLKLQAIAKLKRLLAAP